MSEVRSHLRKLLTSLGLPLASCDGEVTVRTQHHFFASCVLQLYGTFCCTVYRKVVPSIACDLQAISYLDRVNPC